jgi:NAD(P)-dependent dehydrogenase (short-subunit alcohol dehydrogenase family)
VAVLDVDVDRARKVAAQIEAVGRRGLAVEVDVTDSDAIRRAVGEADEWLGRLDILVNNAGGVRPGLFVEQDERRWRRHMDMNLVSVFAATHVAANAMIRGGRGGAIVNVTSIEGSRAAPMFAVYGACKAAIHGFTRTMAVELGQHGVRVNAVAPDWIRTGGNSGFLRGPLPAHLPDRPAAIAEQLSHYIPLEREGTEEECGEAIAFLCSPAASYISGAILPVDGGTWASSGWTRTDTGQWSLFGSEPMF